MNQKVNFQQLSSFLLLFQDIAHCIMAFYLSQVYFSMFSSSLLNIQTVPVILVLMHPCNNSTGCFSNNSLWLGNNYLETCTFNLYRVALWNNSGCFLLFSDCSVASWVCVQAAAFLLQRCLQNYFVSAFGTIPDTLSFLWFSSHWGLMAFCSKIVFFCFLEM